MKELSLIVYLKSHRNISIIDMKYTEKKSTLLYRYGCGSARQFKNTDGSFHSIQKIKCQWNREWTPTMTELPVGF